MIPKEFRNTPGSKYRYIVNGDGKWHLAYICKSCNEPCAEDHLEKICTSCGKPGKMKKVLMQETDIHIPRMFELFSEKKECTIKLADFTKKGPKNIKVVDKHIWYFAKGGGT